MKFKFFVKLKIFTDENYLKGKNLRGVIISKNKFIKSNYLINNIVLKIR